MKRLICGLLLLCLLLAGCAEEVLPQKEEDHRTKDTLGSVYLSGNVKKEAPIVTAIVRPYHGMMTDLSVRLLQESLLAEEDRENLLISPLSVLYALGMVSDGADDTESVKAFWGNLDQLHINEFFYEYANSLPRGEKVQVTLANSVWFKDEESFTVDENFLHTMVNYYGADIYKAPFDDQTRKDINRWSEIATKGMVKDVVDRIPEDSVMYLVNALAFEGEWETPYTKDQQREGVFTAADGSRQTCDFLYGCEDTYLEDDLAVGFTKPYDFRGYGYEFVALVPKDGVTVEEYVASLTGESLRETLNGKSGYAAITSMPVFETEYDVDMKDVLRSIGYPVDGTFNGVGSSTEGDIVMTRVLHKTFIRVDAKGTKAGAVTAVEMGAGGMPTFVEVDLDRPFVYMIVEEQHKVPLFIGVMKDLEE